ncbi:sugar-binding domain-containing protein [Parasediminibacterium sp. JCM 36343]|uniref:sugar-binding domain-containing protein n=1 Tax=Parasediminibacterium sp. JCM 36343 TaxID=3374279 RepID=UPI00397D3EF8
MKKISLGISLYVFLFNCITSFAQDRVTTDLSGGGWKLWKDADTTWKQEEVFLPPVDIAKLPIHLPTGGWDVLNNSNGLNVQVPGTAEEYLQKISGPDGDIKGVSWWYRSIQVPALGNKHKVLLRFEAARYRSEVFINHQLVGYDLIGNTPFEVDITNAVKPGETVQLAVRVTDPGGNFDWGDGDNIQWGKVKVTGSHGFGGITGRVQLISCNEVYIDDIYVQNTPEYHTANAIITLKNATAKVNKTNLSISVREKKNPSVEVFHTVLKGVTIKPGQDTVSIKINAPTAKLWDIDNPNLYTCQISLEDAGKTMDADKKIFGFRWFELAGIGSYAMYRLNGKRMVLRTAISWGFWPENGIFPTPELAEKQVRLAKTLGLNMLNFHRCIGSPIIMEKADEIGLLYYEEPGNYLAGNKDAFSRACMREKLCRMVKRDRSHPCMIIYTMQNEMRDVDSLLFISHRSDMRAVHEIDPSRVIVRTSGWAIEGIDKNDQAKLHMRPFDTAQYMSGWFDYHRAPGSHTWMQSLYKSPTDFYGYTTNKKEIVYWGEEGALSTPSRLGLIKKAVEKQPNIGWDGAMYLDEYKAFDEFIQHKKLQNTFPSVDALTSAMGAISLEHQGRKIENIRVGNVSDGYAINGWESEILENHSGIVDCYRNPKADPAILAYYNQPLYVAVKPRKQVVELPGNVAVDFYIVNEKNLKGNFSLELNVKDPNGKAIFTKQIPVAISGGDMYGQLIADSIPITLSKMAGMYKIIATIKNPSGIVATGHDEILGVDWQSQSLKGTGAVWENGNIVKAFLKDAKQKEVPNYTDAAKKLDWLVVSRSPKGGDITIVPNEQLRDVTGKTKGVTATYYVGADFDKQVAQQVDKDINLTVYSGATPHPNVPTTYNYSIKWEGSIVPPYTGRYHFEMEVAYGGDGTLFINGKKLAYDAKAKLIKGDIELTEGKAVSIKATLQHRRHSGACRLFWAIPDPLPIDGQTLINRVKDDGTTLVIIDNSDAWMELIAKNTSLKYTDKFKVGTNWLGGVAFAKEHPLFKDLPVNQGLNWPYEAVVHNGNERLGFEMEGEELVAGSYHCYPQKLGTSVGIINCGKGKIIFSTLDICGNLQSPESTSAVAKKLLCNYIDFAGAK